MSIFCYGPHSDTEIVWFRRVEGMLHQLKSPTLFVEQQRKVGSQITLASLVNCLRAKKHLWVSLLKSDRVGECACAWLSTKSPRENVTEWCCWNL